MVIVLTMVMLMNVILVVRKVDDVFFCNGDGGRNHDEGDTCDDVGSSDDDEDFVCDGGDGGSSDDDEDEDFVCDGGDGGSSDDDVLCDGNDGRSCDNEGDTCDDSGGDETVTCDDGGGDESDGGDDDNCLGYNALEKICHELKTANTILRHQLLCVNTELNEARFGANVIANNDDKTCFYTGLPRFALFLTLYDIVKPYFRSQKKQRIVCLIVWLSYG